MPLGWRWCDPRCFLPAIFWFLMSFLCDKGSKTISITRLLVVFFAGLDAYSVWASPGHGITANHLWLAITCIAAGFGKSTFTFLLQRLEMKTQQTVTENFDMAAIINAVKARRANGVTEPTP